MNSKKNKIIDLIFGIGFIIVLSFYFNNIPGTSLLIIIVCTPYAVYSNFQTRKFDSKTAVTKKFKSVFIISAYFYSIVCVSIMFKLLFWPGSQTLVYFGTITGIVLLYFTRWVKLN